MFMWLLIITFLASVCSASMGAAWLLGVRDMPRLWWASAGSGAIVGTALSVWAGSSILQAIYGACYGLLVGTGTWLLLWLGVRPFLKAIAGGKVDKR